MCMTDREIRRILDTFIREQVSEGMSDLSFYEWNCIADDYVCRIPASRCAGALKMSVNEVEKLYEIFSINVVAGSLSGYLQSA